MLEGTYRIVSSTRTIVDTGEVVDTYGAQPTGFINYGRDGRLLVLVVWDARDRPGPASVEAITDTDRINLFRTMLAYGGTFTFDGSTVVHHIDISWNQVWTGSTLLRSVRRDGDRLVYTTPPAAFSGDGRMSVMTIVWQKLA